MNLQERRIHIRSLLFVGGGCDDAKEICKDPKVMTAQAKADCSNTSKGGVAASLRAQCMKTCGQCKRQLELGRVVRELY